MTTENDTELAKRASELQKRYATAHKMSLGKVAQHLSKAKSMHKAGMGALQKAAKCMVDAQKLGKAVDMNTMATHMANAADKFGSAGDAMDDMQAHLGNAMAAWGHSTNVDPDTEVGGMIHTPALPDMTEGDVPWYDADMEYGGGGTEEEPYKAAKATVQKVNKALASGELLTKAQAEKMVAEAAEKAKVTASNEALAKQVESLSKTVEMLQRMPAGNPKVKIFDFDKSNLPGINGEGEGESGSVKLAKLIDGVDLNIRDEGDFNKASSTMIANMIKNGPKFGHDTFGKAPMWDPSFKGRGGTGARN